MIEFFDAKEYIPSFNRTLHGQEFQRQGLQHAESNGSIRKRIEAFRHCKKAKNQFFQSLRHAIERHNREEERTERIISEIAEEKKVRQKAEQEKLENESKQREKQERQKLIAKTMSPVAGPFLYVMNIQTFESLEFVLQEQWNHSFLYRF